MTTTHKALGEVQADAKGRVALSKARVQKGDRFLVRETPDGDLLLERMVSIPASEIDLWDDPRLLAEVRRGLAEYAAGDLVEGDDFTGYVEDSGG